MSRRHRSTLRSISEMNLTSMMDLTFLLLITFIITFPLIEQGIPINLPVAKSQSIDTSKKSTVISVDHEGRIFYGQDPVTSETLESRLKIMVAEDQDMRLIIRGDENVNYGAVVSIAKIANNLGISRIALATKEK